MCIRDSHLGAPGFVGGSKAEAKEIAIRMGAIDAARGAEALGTYYEAMGEFDAAGEQFEEARRLNPDGMRPLLKQAGFLARRGKHDESDELFDLAFSRDPEQKLILVADGRRHAVHVLRRDTLEVLATMGRRGRWAGQFESPHSPVSYTHLTLPTIYSV